MWQCLMSSSKGNKNIVELPVLLFFLFDSERRADFKFVPFVVFFI